MFFIADIVVSSLPSLIIRKVAKTQSLAIQMNGRYVIEEDLVHCYGNWTPELELNGDWYEKNSGSNSGSRSGSTNNGSNHSQRRKQAVSSTENHIISIPRNRLHIPWRTINKWKSQAKKSQSNPSKEDLNEAKDLKEKEKVKKVEGVRKLIRTTPVLGLLLPQEKAKIRQVIEDGPAGSYKKTHTEPEYQSFEILVVEKKIYTEKEFVNSTEILDQFNQRTGRYKRNDSGIEFKEHDWGKRNGTCVVFEIKKDRHGNDVIITIPYDENIKNKIIDPYHPYDPNGKKF